MKNDTEKVYVYTLDTKAFVGDVQHEKTSCSGSSSTQKVFVGPPHKLWALVHSIEFQLAITAVLSLLDVSSSSSWWMAAGFFVFWGWYAQRLLTLYFTAVSKCWSATFKPAFSMLFLNPPSVVSVHKGHGGWVHYLFIFLITCTSWFQVFLLLSRSDPCFLDNSSDNCFPSCLKWAPV